ncbi:MAG: hypothetical protein ABI903_12115 [Actinomycetota bacterium]
MASPMEVGARLMGYVVGLLLFWLVVVIVGFNVNGLLWLGMSGSALFVGTALFGASNIDVVDYGSRIDSPKK